jgi:hypothetical protein
MMSASFDPAALSMKSYNIMRNFNSSTARLRASPI